MRITDPAIGDSTAIYNPPKPRPLAGSRAESPKALAVKPLARYNVA
jgi:hypothetical protein